VLQLAVCFTDRKLLRVQKLLQALKDSKDSFTDRKLLRVQKLERPYSFWQDGFTDRKLLRVQKQILHNL